MLYVTDTNDQDSPINEQPSTDIWTGFGFAIEDGKHMLPSGVVGFEATGKDATDALTDFLKTMGVPPFIATRVGDRDQALYRLAEPDLLTALTLCVPAAVRLIQPGQGLALPGTDQWQPQTYSARSVEGLSELTAEDMVRLGLHRQEPAITENPLLPFSLRGQSGRFKRLAIEATPLLGEVCLRGQVTIWYAGPGTGKTLLALSLLIDAVREKRIPPANIFYVNADDNGSGFATKLQLMDDIGANTLAPGFKNFRASELITLLHSMAEKDQARGALIVIDTIKKFASLMDKREASQFAQACRQVAMMGGTVLGLAHTTKNSNADGTPRYAGTSDLVDDADAAYVLTSLNLSTADRERVVEFRCFKARGDCADKASYAFAAERGLSYDELLSSVRSVDPMQLDEFKRIEQQCSDADVIEAVKNSILAGVNTKMLLAKEVANRTGVSSRSAGRLIERYTGNDPALHHWRFDRGERGAQIFELLSPPA